MQRVVDLEAKERAVADARNAVVNEPSGERTHSSVTDECRRLAELLRLDAVGVAAWRDGRRVVTSWTAPGSAPLAEPLDDVLEGPAPGWLVCPLPDRAAVFGRTTPHTSSRALAVLEAVAPSLAQAAAAASGAPERPSGDDLVDVRDTASPDVVDVVPPADENVAALRQALADLRDALEFDSALLYLPAGGRTWAVAARVGPERPWHPVLDPAAMGAVGEGIVHADARTLPGIGGRLAELGCGAVAVLPVAGGGRVIVDAASVRRRTPRVNDLAPYLDRVGGVVRRLDGRDGDDELAVVERVTAAVRSSLEDPEASVDGLLEAARAALEADELFHVQDRDGDITVVSAAGPPRRLPRTLRDELRSLPLHGVLDEETARHVAVVLGVDSPRVSAAFAGEAAPVEGLVAGWRGRPALSPTGVRAVAQLLGTARTVVESRRRAVDVMMTRERNRWAYEIHDGLTQAVTTAVLELEALGRHIQRDPEEAVQMLAATRAEIRRALSELRGMLYELSGDRPGSAEQVAASDEPLTKYVNDVVKRWRLPAKVQVKGDLADMPKSLLGAAYVVIREALANSAKHAGARSVSVLIHATKDELTVEVGDTGRGFRADAGNGSVANGSGRHFGLEMIRKRVAEVGGTLDVSSSPGRGTRVVAHLPVGEGTR